MDVALEPMDEDVTVASRPAVSPLHDLLAQIESDEKYHGKFMKLAAFPLPKEKGKAHQQKQNMTNYYGNTPAVLGFEFAVTRSTDGLHEYLGVTFRPERIQDGAYEAFQSHKAQKAQEAKERKAERETEALKAAARAEIDALEDDE